MSLIVFSDLVMPNSIMVAGAAGARARVNTRTRNQGGYATVNVVRDVTLRTYQIGTAPMLPDLAATVVAIHEATDAGAFGFLLEDPVDNRVSAAEGKIILNADDVFQLWKRYTAPGGSRARDRRITRPLAGWVVYEDGVPMGGGVSIDLDTGVVTITDPDEEAVYTWSGRFYVPVHFRDDVLEWDLVVAGNYESRRVAMNSIYLDEIREA